MSLLWGKVLLAGVWGGALSVERKAFLQAMFSRPLVAATGMGLLLGDLRSGLFVGLLLELFHLGAASLGAAISEHDTLAATGASAFAATVALREGGSTPAIWSLAILLLAGLGPLGQRFDRALEGYAGRLASRALELADRGELSRAMQLNLWGMWPHFVLYGALTAFCALLGLLVAPLAAHLPLSISRALAWAYPAMAAVAAAVAAKGSHAKKAASFAGAAAVLAAIVGAMVLWGGR